MSWSLYLKSFLSSAAAQEYAALQTCQPIAANFVNFLQAYTPTRFASAQSFESLQATVQSFCVSVYSADIANQVSEFLANNLERLKTAGVNAGEALAEMLAEIDPETALIIAGVVTGVAAAISYDIYQNRGTKRGRVEDSDSEYEYINLDFLDAEESGGVGFYRRKKRAAEVTATADPERLPEVEDADTDVDEAPLMEELAAPERTAIAAAAKDGAPIVFSIGKAPEVAKRNTRRSKRSVKSNYGLRPRRTK